MWTPSWMAWGFILY